MSTTSKTPSDTRHDTAGLATRGTGRRSAEQVPGPGPGPSQAPVIVSDLRVAYRSPGGLLGGRTARREVVRGVSFEVAAGRTVALVGQSGSGKSTIAHTIAGLLPAGGAITGGRVEVHGQDVAGLTRRDWRHLHGKTIGFIPQDPLSSLDPLQRVGSQIAQSLLVHRVVPRSEISSRVVALLEQVGIPDPAQRAKAFPHQLSGGQLQRVLIAIAIAANPSVLVADEPTSALDVTVQQRILDLIGTLSIDLGLATLLITHDLALAQERSDTLVVLEGGQVRDAGPSADVVARPTSPYTVRLLGDAPVQSPERYAHLRPTTQQLGQRPAAVSVSEVTKVFGEGASQVTALDAVTLEVRQGSVHALVGESGSGKTTLARVVAGLADHDSGSVHVGGRELPALKAQVNHHADQLQMLHQNPYAAIDPRFSVQRTIEEPLLLRGGLDRRERAARVRDILEQVALPTTVLGRRTRELSGGQRQRVAIARALVLAPQVLVLDEPTSALDVSIQAQVIDLLMALQSEHDLTYLFITHDLSLVRQISDRTSVLHRGTLVEDGATREVFAHPRHPYTQRLLEAVPGIHRIREASRA